MINVNNGCELECRITYGPSSTTCAYYAPVYDKHGNNTNPDGNITTTMVKCFTCDTKWVARTQYGKTTFEKLTMNS